jgi:hypothetical protein
VRGLRNPHVISQLEFKAQPRKYSVTDLANTRTYAPCVGASGSHKIAVIRDPLLWHMTPTPDRATRAPSHVTRPPLAVLVFTNRMGPFLVIVDANQPETPITVHHTNGMPVIVLFSNK